MAISSIQATAEAGRYILEAYKRRDAKVAIIKNVLDNPDSQIPDALLPQDIKIEIPEKDPVRFLVEQMRKNGAMGQMTDRSQQAIGSIEAKYQKDDQLLQRKLEAANTINAENAEVRDIATGTGLTKLTQQHAGILEMLNHIIAMNNEFYQHKRVGFRECSHELQKESRMPQFTPEDLVAITNGQSQALSRHGQISRVIYAELLHQISARINHATAYYRRFMEHMAQKPDGLDEDLWIEQASRRDIFFHMEKTTMHASGKETLKVDIRKWDDGLLDLPNNLLIDTDGNIVATDWGLNAIQYYLDDKAKKLNISKATTDTGAAIEETLS